MTVDSLKGIYVLIIEVSQGAEIQVGTLGNVHFAKGLYAYVGSAQNGLEKRVERHIRRRSIYSGTLTTCLRIPTHES